MGVLLAAMLAIGSLAGERPLLFVASTTIVSNDFSRISFRLGLDPAGQPVALLTDGGGGWSSPWLARFSTAPVLTSSAPVGGLSRIQGFAVSSDDRIWVSGSDYNTRTEKLLIFDEDLKTAGAFSKEVRGYEVPYGVIVAAPDGVMVIGGAESSERHITSPVLSRYTSDGKLLSSGTLLIDARKAGVSGLGLGSDGTIWAAGYSGTLPDDDVRLWVARVSPVFGVEHFEWIAQAKTCRDRKMVTGPFVTGVSVSPSGGAVVIGAACGKAFISQHEYRGRQVRFAVLQDLYPSSVIHDADGGIVLAGHAGSGTLWMSKYAGVPGRFSGDFQPVWSSTLTAGQFGLAVSNQASEFWFTGTFPWGASRKGVLLAKFAESGPASVRPVGSLDWLYRPPSAEPAAIALGLAEARRWAEEGRRSSSADPRRAAESYEKARAAAYQIQDVHLMVEYDRLAALEHIKLGQEGKARELLERALVEIMRSYDERATIAVLESLVGIHRRQKDDVAFRWKGDELYQRYARTGEAEKAADILIETMEAGLRAGKNHDYWTLIHFSELLDRLGRLGRRPSCSLARDVGAYGVRRRRNYSAYRALKEAVASAHAEGNERCLASAKAWLGAASFELGAYSDAIRLESEAITGAAKLGDPLTEQLATSYLGRVYERIGNFETALVYLSRAKTLAEAQKSADMEASVAFAQALLELGRESEAFKTLEAAELAFPGQNVYAKGLADYYLRTGNPRQAYEFYKHGIDYTRMGPYHLAVGELDKAEQQFAGWRQNGFFYGNSGWVVGGEIGLGRVAEARGKFDEAVAHYKRAVEDSEMLRPRLAEEDRLGALGGREWVFSRADAYEGLVRSCRHAKDGLAGSFYYAEAARARSFVEVLSARRKVPPLPAALQREKEALEAEIEKERERYFSITADTVSARQHSVLFEREAAYATLLSAWDRRKAFVERLRSEAPWHAQVRFPKPADIAEVQLEPDEAIIQFEVTAESTKVFVLRSKRVVFSFDVQVSRRQMRRYVEEYALAFEAVDRPQDLANVDMKAGHAIFHNLIRPVLLARDAEGKTLIGKGDRLIIVPDEMLSLVAFEALPTSLPERLEFPSSRFGPVPVGLSYFGDEYDIAYQQSTTALIQGRRIARKAAAAEGRLLLVADPVFGPSDSRGKGAGAFARRPERLRSRRDDIGERIAYFELKKMGVGGLRSGEGGKAVAPEDDVLPRLDETSELAEEFGGRTFVGKTTTLQGLEASEQRLAALPLSQFTYMVFATHGLLQNAVPQVHEPALVLSQIGNPPDRDGFLTASEVGSMKLNAELVALTACSTGLGRSVTGEGVLSLGRSFQLAGSRKVLMSLWEVSGDSTVQLTKLFFARIEKGESPRRALRGARSELRRLGYEHPYYWAPFVLVTD